MQDSTLQFDGGQPAVLVFKRRDGHELSFSSYQRSLVEFDKRGREVKDHGSFVGTEKLLSVVGEFLAD